MKQISGKAPRNRTLAVTAEDAAIYSARLLRPSEPLPLEACLDRVICGDMTEMTACLPDACADLLILDPPYNLEKTFGKKRFAPMSHDQYMAYLRSWFPGLMRLLKPEASVYWCGDWRCSAAIELVMREYLTVRNRIVWQREKGRGAAENWKNSCEDIWFGTVGKRYYFDLAAVKIRRRVRTPYRENGQPKDWQEDARGKTRLSCPGNFWDDITVPFWSMPENTEHPTQKPEKLLAKLILASCPDGGVVLDPFLGSGSTAVTAKKLGRHFIGIEQSERYCIWAEARLERAETSPEIQGFSNGEFLERNFS